MLLISSPRFAEHTTPPGHPERPERAGVFDAVAAGFASARRPRRGARAGDARRSGERVHTAAYLDRIAATAGTRRRCSIPTRSRVRSRTRSRAWPPARRLRPRDTRARRASPRSRSSVRRAITPSRTGRWASASTTTSRSRPPRLRAEGVGASRHRRHRRPSRQRHAGGVLRGSRPCCSSRATSFRTTREPAPPTKSGAGAGRGFTLNLPLEAGATDADYERVYESRVVPALEAFAPDVLLVSAGYDAHERDPLAGMRMTAAGYAHVCVRLLGRRRRRRLCGRRIGAWSTEGGYHLDALPRVPGRRRSAC